MELNGLFSTVLRDFEYFCYIKLPGLSEQPVSTSKTKPNKLALKPKPNQVTLDP